MPPPGAAELTPQPPPLKEITVGETPIYVKPSLRTTLIPGQEVQDMTIPRTSERSGEGLGSAILYKKEEGGYKAIQVDDARGQLDWNAATHVGIVLDGQERMIPKDEYFTLDNPQTTPSPGRPTPVPEPTPGTSREVLSVLGLKGIREKARDLTEKYLRTEGDHWKNFFREQFTYQYTNYYENLLKASRNPLSDESLRIAESRAKEKYQEELRRRNPLRRAARKLIEGFKDRVGATTLVQDYALEEVGHMREAGEIREGEAFRSESQATNKRFETVVIEDAASMSNFIRKELGEKVIALDPNNAEHQPILTGIRDIILQYQQGTIANEGAFNEAIQNFVNGLDPDIRKEFFPQTELFSGSLHAFAERIKAEHNIALGAADIEARLADMEIRLGVASIGEVTSLKPTDTEKAVKRIAQTVDLLNTKVFERTAVGRIAKPIVVNPVVVGTAVSAAMSLRLIPQSVASRTARVWLGAFGGGAVAGYFGYRRELGKRKVDFAWFLRQREAGVTPNDRMSKWYERFGIKLRSAQEIVHAIRSPIYEADGTTLRKDITQDQLRDALANLADAKARQQLGAERRIGLIMLGPKEQQEQNRTILATTVDKAERDLGQYFASGGANAEAQAILSQQPFDEYVKTLTETQIRVLNEGEKAIRNASDPVKRALGTLSSFTPEANIVKRRFGLGEEKSTGKKAQGLEDVLAEFKRAAKVEAKRRGIIAGTTGVAVGALVQEILMDSTHLIQTGQLEGRGAIVQAINELTRAARGGLAPGVAEAAELGGQTHFLAGGVIQLSDNLQLDPTGNLDIIGPDGTILHDNVVSSTQISFDNGRLSQGTLEALSKNIKDLGFDLHTATDTIPGVPVEPGEAIPEILSRHEVQLPGLPDIVDASGVRHPITAAIPDGTRLDRIRSGGFNLIDSNDNVLLQGVTFDADGHIANLTDADLQAEAAQHGITFDDLHETVTIMGEGVPSGDTFDIRAGFLDEHTNYMGHNTVWEWGERTLQADRSLYPHFNADDNLFKNAFRAWHNFDGSNNADIVQSEVPGVTRLVHRVEGGFRMSDGTIGYQNSLDFNHLSDNLYIRDVPTSLFSEDKIGEVGNLMEKTLQDVDAFTQAQVATGHGAPNVDEILAHLQATNELEYLAYKHGYIGQYFTETDWGRFRELFEGPGTSTLTLHQAQIIQQLFPTIGVGETLVNTISVTGPEDQLPIPILPIIPGRQGIPVENILILYGYGGSYTGEGLGWVDRSEYEKRRSKTLNQNPYMKLDESAEIASHLSRMDPTYRVELEEMDHAIGEPMSAETRAVITLPVFGEGKNIRKTLEQFLNQKDKNGNPLDPSKFEIIVFENDTEARPKDETEEEVRKFKTAHPEIKVHYAYRRWTQEDIANQVNTVGNGRRYTCDIALLRSSKRSSRPGDIIIVNGDADLEGIISKYISDVIELFDSNEELDYVVGKRNLPNWALKKPNIRAGQRLWETFDAVMRHTGGGDSLEPTKRQKGWPGLIGENSAMRASIYAAVGGYGAKARLAEDQNLGDMIRVARNYDDDRFEYINRLQTIKNPRRYLTYMAAGKPLIDMYNDYHENKNIRKIDNHQLLNRIPDTFDVDRFQLDADGIYQKKYDYKSIGEEGFEARFKKTMDFMGVEYIIENGHVKIVNADKLISGLSRPV